MNRLADKHKRIGVAHLHSRHGFRREINQHHEASDSLGVNLHDGLLVVLAANFVRLESNNRNPAAEGHGVLQNQLRYCADRLFLPGDPGTDIGHRVISQPHTGQRGVAVDDAHNGLDFILEGVLPVEETRGAFPQRPPELRYFRGRFVFIAIRQEESVQEFNVRVLKDRPEAPEFFLAQVLPVRKLEDHFQGAGHRRRP